MSDIQLNADEALEFQRVAAECDGRVEGFRLGMELCKKMALGNILKQRQIAANPAAPDTTPPQPDPTKE